MSAYKQQTVKGYEFSEVASAFQKSIRRGLEAEAMYWAIELYESNYDEYLWKRMRIITSEDVGLANGSLPAVIHALYSTYTELKKKKDERHRPERLQLTHAVLKLCRAKKSRVVDHCLIASWENHAKEKKAIPDYALDKHTLKGKKMGRGWGHFFKEGTLLEPQANVKGEQDYKAQAEESKCQHTPLFS